MNRFDTHVHSVHSPDGKSDLAAYAAQIDAGVADGIGFAEHHDFLPLSGGWTRLNASKYRADVAAWVARGYRFYAGVEVEFARQVEDQIRSQLKDTPFAFVIGSIHTLASGSVSDRNIDHFSDPGTFERILEEYELEFTACLDVPEFDVVGHPGVFQRYLGEAFFEGKPWRSRIRDLEAVLAARTARSGKLLEVNTSGLFTAMKSTCATPFFLEQFRAHGGRDITLASDSHAAVHLRRGFGEAAAMLAGLGFDRVHLPWDREHPVPLAEYAAL